jgi:hypothetical protein
MATSQQLRSRAAEFGELIKVAHHPDEIRQLRRQERALTDLANNQDWLANNRDKLVGAARTRDDDEIVLWPLDQGSGDGTPLTQDEERILRCLGAAVIMQWNTVPTKLKKELSDNASSLAGLLEAGAGEASAAVKGQIARFLHNHKDDDPAPKAEDAPDSLREKVSMEVP